VLWCPHSAHRPQIAQFHGSSRRSLRIQTRIQRTEMSNLDTLVQTLIREGLWSDATGLYRDELGVSLTQAEAKVHAVAQELGITDPHRWTQWLAIGLAGASLFVLAGCLQWIVS
jgi:hypothetical protein